MDGKYAYGYYRLFFMEKGTDHPDYDPEAPIPNWYYYWEQTPAKGNTTHYYNYWDETVETGRTDFTVWGWRSYIGPQACDYAEEGTWDEAEGIDFYAHICRHEERHRLDMIELWGQNPPNGEDDPDGDRLPTDNGTWREEDHRCSHFDIAYDPTRPVTPGIEDHFCHGAGWSDCEDYCMHREVGWSNGSADASDWANPGHQYNQD